MSSHQVIARKWRPQKFGDVVGQTHVIRTLRNAIASNRVGHAYLLVGPRGIGKTTIARIFAKAINCENPHDGEPCCECSSCKALAAENSLDVIEIDAASCNSVEHMRALSEEAYHMPVASKYKIYIIDEVHMLSKAAWNALLKTVEEPPAHVKFIFATTEAHLVLPTIVSRCQRFDLRPIAGNLILSRLKLIAESENVKIAPEALSAIARAAEGGMRDAQSSLEQMLAFFGGQNQEIAAEQVLELFGLTNAVELDTLIAAMLQNQPGPVVTVVNQLAGRGRNLETLFDDVLEMLRGAELMHILNNPGAVLDFDDEKLERCRKLAMLTTPEVLRCFMENLAPVGRVLHEALNKAIYLESILLKAMHEAHAPTVGDVLTRLNQLRGAGELQCIDQIPSFQQQPAMAMPCVLPEITPAPGKKTLVNEVPPAAAPAVQPEPEVQSEPVIQAEETAAATAPAPEITPAVEPEPEIQEPEIEEVSSASSAPPAAEPITPEPAETTANTADQMLDMWNKLLAAAASQAPELPLQNCRPESLRNSVLTIAGSADAITILRSARLKLLTMLQSISGNWAILVDFVNTAPETVSVPEITEQEAIPAESSAEEEVVFSNVETAIPAENQAEDIFSEPVEPIEIQNFTESSFENESGFIELGDGEMLPGDMEEPSRADLGYSKRSVIHKPEEVEATAKLPPVQKVLDLFNGEIVDIHA